MDTRLRRRARLWLAAASLAAMVQSAGGAAARPTHRLYAKRGSLQATMLATRAEHRAWRAEQGKARGAVTLGPWHSAAVAAEPAAVDLAAKGKDGKPLWRKQAGWRDGALVPLANGVDSEDGRAAAVIELGDESAESATGNGAKANGAEAVVVEDETDSPTQPPTAADDHRGDGKHT